MVTRSQAGIVKPIDRLSLHTSPLSPIPKSPFLSLKDPNWSIAMHDEYNALVKNGTWILVPRPSNVNLVRSMWLFKHKFHADGTLSRYKARLVANGSSQQLGVDFDKTFSLVVKPATNAEWRYCSLLKLPLEERLKIQLLEGPPVQRFKALKHIAQDDSDSDIFKVLQTHGVLVQGLWVAKTNLKYAGITDIKKPIARDYVLLQFSKNPIFHESQLPKSLAISETMKGILGEFARRRDSCRDWKFKEHPDNLFIKEHPEVVAEQKNSWDAAEPQLMKMLFSKTSKVGTSDKPPVSASNTAPKITKVTPSRTVVLDENREALLKVALQKLLQTYKVLSWQQIRQKLRDMAVSENTHPKGSRDARAATAAAEAKDDDLKKILTEVAVEIHGAYVLRPPPDPSEYDRIRHVVINLFIAEGSGGKLKKASIFEAAKSVLKREITTAEYQKIMNEMCISKNSAWVLKSVELQQFDHFQNSLNFLLLEEKGEKRRENHNNSCFLILYSQYGFLLSVYACEHNYDPNFYVGFGSIGTLA
ncbi:DNA-directed RNA polymerase III subunit RPC5 [Tanacetum coccineum]